MEKVKKLWRSIPIWLTLVLLMVVFLLLATFATGKTSQWATGRMMSISVAYEYNHTENENEAVIYFDLTRTWDEMSEEDKNTYTVYQMIYQYSALVWYPLFVVIAAFLFYRFKMKEPLEILSNASKKIAANDLDFHIEYEGSDEMARLCQAFETMRSSVQQNNISMWRSVEERKRVNSAFAHDLRTPITVMKGYADMLQNYMPKEQLTREKEIQTVSKIQNNIGRLEQYIASMSAIQKLEDLEMEPAFVKAENLVTEIKEVADILCKENRKKFTLQSTLNVRVLSIDRNILMQICENLMANAVRFCWSEIQIIVNTDKDYITVSVLDDGPGFTVEALEMAKKPFYKGEDTSADMHFGLGLYICNLLCEKHGGSCRLSNHKSGGAEVTFTLKSAG